jgi:hypothetical protein
MPFKFLFSEAFDTFKVFENLSFDIVTQITPGIPKTVWQILNHLIIWQESQLLLLKGEAPEKPITEMETWIKTEVPTGQNEIDNAVSIFDTQLFKIKIIVSTLSLKQTDIEFKLKTLQDMSNHLSFHLGEIILIRRQCKNYPMPEKMKAFLE